MANYFVVPNSGTILYSGSIVILSEYPGTKWIVKHGWYSYNSIEQNGWYFKRVPDGEILPSTEVDLSFVTVVSSSQPANRPQPYPPCEHEHHHHHGHQPPMPPSGPMSNKAEEQANRAFVTVDTLRQRDALERSPIPNGKLVRVNDVNGETKYYEYVLQSRTWVEVDMSYMRKSDTDNLYVAQADFDWKLLSEQVGGTNP